jgi:hypothetical protein
MRRHGRPKDGVASLAYARASIILREDLLSDGLPGQARQ